MERQTGPLVTRRAFTLGGLFSLGAAGQPLGAQVALRGELAGLASAELSAELRTVIVTDRGESSWRRFRGRPQLPENLIFRSADRFRPDGRHDPIDGGWWMIDEPTLRATHAGAKPGLLLDSWREIQAILDASAALQRPIDDLSARYRVDRPVVVPRGVVWRGANLQAGTPGMNVVLIHSYAQLLDFEIRGTGSISRRMEPGPGEVNERAIYPAADGLCGAIMRGRISNITVGVHLQPLSENASPPTACRIDVELNDIVGQPGTSEGYGVLLSPADWCTVRVRARDVQRHAVYLSAGASNNYVDADVDTCFQDAVTICSFANQPPCVENHLAVTARGIRMPEGEPPAINSCCFSIYGKADRNVSRVISVGSGAETGGPYAAALVHGLGSPDGPFPRGNRLTVNASGQFTGPYVVQCTDAIETTIEGGMIDGCGSVGVIGFTDTRTNRQSFERAGRVTGVTIAGRFPRMIGIAVATERSAVVVDANVQFGALEVPIRDFTGRLLRGR